MSSLKLSTLERALIDRIRLLRPKVKSLLEVGCGEGNKLVYLKKNTDIKVSGIDIYPPFVATLNQSGITTILGNAVHLPYKDSAFDWLLIANSIHHIPNPEAALSEAIRVAAAGVIIVEPWFDNSLYSQQLTAELAAYYIKLQQSLGYFHRSGLNAGEIINLINCEISNIKIFYELFPEELDLEESLKVQDKHIEKLPENHYLLWELKQIKQKLRDKFLSKPGQLVLIIRK
jgi:ubiquinone/menaquinone biosynthesis C-methylase UbiE